MKNFRDFLHVLAGITLGYLLNLTFDGVPLFARLVLGGIFSTCIGFGWEWYWAMTTHSKEDKFDAIRTIAGCFATILTMYLLA
jgi:hypothetical protein